MDKIRIGHIGTLHDHSQSKMAAARKFADVFEVVGIVPESEEQYNLIKDCQDYAGVPVMTEKELFAAGVDAVMVEGFELELVNIAQRCLDHNVHVHVDKPAGADIEAFRHMLSDAKKKDLVVQMAYMYRYNPAVQDCLKKFRAGELGEVFEVDAIMNTEHSPEKRQWLSNFPGGIMFYLGCHMIDLIYMFQGVPEDIITFNKSTGFNGVHAIDHSCAMLEYKNGVSLARATSTEVNGFGRRQLVVCGSRATYEIEPIECPLKAFYTDNTYSTTYGDKRKALAFDNIDDAHRYDSMMLEFAKCVRGEMKNPFTYEYELRLQMMILKACGINIDYKGEICL